MVRGALIAVLLVFMAGATNLPSMNWWRESVTARPLATFAAILRSMGNVELELFRSQLTKPQQRLLGRIRHYRSILWRMIPEGA